MEASSWRLRLMEARPEDASQCPRPLKLLGFIMEAGAHGGHAWRPSLRMLHSAQCPLSCWGSSWRLRLMEAKPEDASQCTRPLKLLGFIMEDEAHGGQA